MSEVVTMAHGDGGEAAHRLVRDIILTAFGRGSEPLPDAVHLPRPEGRIALTTDSFVIKPLFFPGGSIGKLAVAGTVNDLAVSGAVPLYLTAAFILEEGFPLSDLRRVAEAMALEAAHAGVTLVAGDTKVVEKGSGDGIYINTTGIGVVPDRPMTDPYAIREGDAVILSGTVGDHGTAVLSARNEWGLVTESSSDCASLNHMLQAACRASDRVRVMRDPTRGGLATALVELCEDYGAVIELDGDVIPIRPEVEGMCELLGFDPLYLANEGKAVLIVEESAAAAVLEALRGHPEGREAAVIGRVTGTGEGRLLLKTPFGASRRLHRLTGSMLPRIC
ncbi:hydrogenase expression/formation protein HypE [Gorillibacterium sp. sgz5001074]|uniref:hydrogenase expression/formation protein HypE n=1 Tax=Gorillibacterium sp. sgz5001074 TaxID=3446695 RepID=UPI003F674A5B